MLNVIKLIAGGFIFIRSLDKINPDNVNKYSAYMILGVLIMII